MSKHPGPSPCDSPPPAGTADGRSREELLAEIDTVRANIKSDAEEPYRASDYDREVYARRDTLDLYWLRIPNRQPDRVALQTAAAFLGVRLDCTQCHKHPFDRWTTLDFEQFQSFFRTMEYRYSPTGGPLSRKGRIAYGRDELVVGLNDRYQRTIEKYPGRSTNRNTIGRDHNVYGFSSWFAGGGFKAGHIHGATDEFGYKAVVNPVSHSDYHATLLHLLGLDPERLVFRDGQRELHLSDGRHPALNVHELLT